LRQARREMRGLREENEALRFQSALREEEFHVEEKERRRTQAELQRIKSQLQQLQRKLDGQQVCSARIYSTECDKKFSNLDILETVVATLIFSRMFIFLKLIQIQCHLLNVVTAPWKYFYILQATY